jgi:hypothetical protein
MLLWHAPLPSENPLTDYESNEHLICPYSQEVYPPNFISIRQGVRHDKCPTELGRKKEMNKKKNREKRSGRWALLARDHNN